MHDVEASHPLTTELLKIKGLKRFVLIPNGRHFGIKQMMPQKSQRVANWGIERSTQPVGKITIFQLLPTGETF